MLSFMVASSQVIENHENADKNCIWNILFVGGIDSLLFYNVFYSSFFFCPAIISFLERERLCTKHVYHFNNVVFLDIKQSQKDVE